jgi:hypothetical protein
MSGNQYFTTLADKPPLRSLSFLVRPISSAHHRWAMACGEASLSLELVRLRKTKPENPEHLCASTRLNFELAV